MTDNEKSTEQFKNSSSYDIKSSKLVEFTDKRDLLKMALLEQQKKIFQIENELIQIEKDLANFSDNLILENLKLSEQQELIINATEDNILVVACPGSGKTHTLISRYVKMILNNQITPEETLLITFTKKAGLEMLNRLSRVLPHKIPYHVGSLHGLGYKVLQEYNDINYTVLDEKDVKVYLRDLINENPTLQQLDDEELGLIKSKIQLIIDQASTTYPFDLKAILKKNNLDKYFKEFNYVYKLYQQKKKKENIVDFNDLMIQFSKFLDEPKSDIFKSKIKYVFFDEYQDVNPVQNYILLKLSDKSKIMVVGDDAQAIYAFRGSSVKYILNFNQTFNDPNKTNSMYLLAENYRSTPSIVDFCQDIISHNTNQFDKSVVSKQDKFGFKPCVYAFKNQKEQYKWVVNDIMEKNKQGVKFSDMVILARKNNLLDEIELHLMGNKIPTVKHIGLSLLDKSHIKDFLAWITLLINPKSSIHWKRIISLHPGYGIKRANEILDSGSDIMNSLKAHIDKEKMANASYTGVTELYDSIQYLKKVKRDIDKARFIVNYLEKLWILKKESNVEGKITDIYNLLNYLKNSSLEQFINDLYLNQEVETNLENVLYLTTVHGAKGLEWEYVYIIDLDSKNFPSVRPKYYLDELEEMDEERRLFYVASSRAKKYLFMTLTQDFNPESQVMVSPLIREINSELYNGCGLIIEKVQPTLVISKDVQNYLRFIGYSKVYDYISQLINTRGCANKLFDIPRHIEKLPYKVVIGNFIDYLIGKILQVNYPKKVKKFDLNLVHKDTKFPQKIYLEYIDPQTDWRNILDHIYYISTYKTPKDTDLSIYHDLLVSQPAFNYYLELEKGICKIINGLKPKEIHTHYVVSFGSVRGEIDILCDDTIIEIKSSISNYNEVATVPNLSQTLLYGYLLKKKEYKVNKIILYNPLNGEVNNFDVSNFNWIKFKKLIYND
jgi:DNA helicase-2/ATP-dependent DNA helicase PcrA